MDSSPEFDDLCETISRQKGVGQIKEFLIDVCSAHELQAVSARWAVVRMLSKSKSYREIQEETGVGNGTITRARQAWQNSAGGFIRVLGPCPKD